MLPRQWHESLLVFLVLFEDVIHRFPLILSYSLSASKVILPPVTTIISYPIPVCIHGFVEHYILPLYYTKGSTQIWVHRETNPHRQTHAKTHILLNFHSKSRNLPKAFTVLKVKALNLITLYNFCPTQVPRTVQRNTKHMKNRDALSNSRFGVVELSLTSRGRAGTQQKKQRAGQGKFLPGSHECLNTTGMHKWNLHDCHDNYTYGARWTQVVPSNTMVVTGAVAICSYLLVNNCQHLSTLCLFSVSSYCHTWRLS